MPTKFDRIVFGESKSINFEKFNIGAAVKAFGSSNSRIREDKSMHDVGQCPKKKQG